MKQEFLAFRDLSYSAFHRPASLARFLPRHEADSLAMLDVDGAYFEFDGTSRTSLVLVEVARDRGQTWKSSTMIASLARMAGLPVYCVLYSVSERGNPADGRFADIEGFRVRRITPRPETNWRRLSPAQWAAALVRIRAWSIKRLGTMAANDDRFG